MPSSSGVFALFFKSAICAGDSVGVAVSSFAYRSVAQLAANSANTVQTKGRRMKRRI
jgi:hypothetical protein